MTDQISPRHPRRTTAVILGVLVLVIAVVTAIALLTAGSATPTAVATTKAPASPVPVASDTPSATAAPTTSAPPTPTPTATPSPTRTTAPAKSVPTPQPTKTATISKPTAVPIKKELTATVLKSEAVTGKADGPGEIAGPSVRFTIRITNTTGKAISLSNTVVNAYYGSAETPAVQLRLPGGVDFPTSVANDASATGVFVFNIPDASRSNVKVTVDTAVQNPVIAFQGTAPRA